MHAWMIIVLIIIIIAIIMILRVVYELHHLKMTEYNLNSKKIPENSKYNIIFISDLHLRKYGKNNEELINAIRISKPCLILIGGDMTIARKRFNEETLFELLNVIKHIAPCIYVPGNHERRLLEEDRPGFSDRFEKLMHFLNENNITYLSNEIYSFDENVNIYGLDPGHDFYEDKNPTEIRDGSLVSAARVKEKQKYNIMLAHFPGYFDEYIKTDADLILSGHYHGGAIKFGNKGMISPHFEFFPKYSYGKYDKGNSSMIVTSGAGTHTINARLFNRPEIVKIRLEASENFKNH